MSISITKQTSYSNTTGYTNRPINYIVVHYTAGSTSKAGSARNTAIMFSNPTVYASADYIVDDETIVQFNPDIRNRFCWHCGDNKNPYSMGGKFHGICTNANSIGIEVCSTNPNWQASDQANSKKWSFTDKVVAKAAELVKYLMQTYDIPIDRVIRHYDVTGKLCPGIIGWNEDSGNAKKWEQFKARLTDVKADTKTDTKTNTTKTNGVIYRVQTGAFAKKENAEAQLKKIVAKGFDDAFVTKADGLYKVQVGAFSVKSNADKCRDKVIKAGFKDCFITTTGTAKKTAAELAKEVIQGKWGNGEERKNRLTAAGYDYKAVQAEVNKMMG